MAPWFVCGECQWSGDIFNLWSSIHSRSIEETLDTFKTRNMFNINDLQLDNKITSHLAYESNRKSVNTGWRTASSNHTLKRAGERELRLLQD